MTKKASQARISSIDKRGKVTELKSQLLEFDFGGGRRLGVYLAEEGVPRIEIVVLDDDADTVLRVDPHSAAAITVSMASSGIADLGRASQRPSGGDREPVLNLKIQKVVSGDDRELAPRKHRIRKWARAALTAGVCDVTIRLVGEAESCVLNRDYRGKDYPTNVLTFVYEREGVAQDESGSHTADARFRGDLVICVPVLAREAHEQGKTLEAHFAHLVVHGMLHLQGYDHESEDQALIMEPLEAKILATLGFGDPYA